MRRPWSPRRVPTEGLPPPSRAAPGRAACPAVAACRCSATRGGGGLGGGLRAWAGSAVTIHAYCFFFFLSLFFSKCPAHAGETTAHCMDGPWGSSPAPPWPPETLIPQQIPLGGVFSHVRLCTSGLLLGREVDLAARLLPLSQQGESVPRCAQRQLCPQPGHRRAGTRGRGASTLPFSLAEREFPVSVAHPACPVLSVFVSLVWMTKDNWVLFVSQLFWLLLLCCPPLVSWELLLPKTSFVLGTRCLHPVHLPVAAGFSSHTWQWFREMSFAHVNVYPYPKNTLSPA